MSADLRNRSDEEVERTFSGRFPVRLPRYLHAQLVRVAEEQGVSLSQFVGTAAVMAAGLNRAHPVSDQSAGWNRVSEDEYSRIWSQRFG